MNHVGWHASSRTINKKAVGVEIANAYYPKYQNWYKKNGFGERPLITDAEVHGKKFEPFMDFYDVQKEALKALMEAVHKAGHSFGDTGREDGIKNCSFRKV